MPFEPTRLLLSKRPTTGIAWSCDGTSIALAQADELSVWDRETWTLSRRFALPAKAVSRPSFGPTRDKVACAIADGDICLWSVETGSRLPLNTTHEFGIRSIEWAPDGSQLAGILPDGQIGIWDCYTGAPRRRLKPRLHASNVLAWSGDSRFLASAGEGRSVCIWEAATGALQKTLEGATSVIFALAWSADAKLLAIGGGDDCPIQVSAVDTRKIVALPVGHQSDVRALSFSPSAEWLASKSIDGSLMVWDCRDWKCHQQIQEEMMPDELVRSIEFCPTGQCLASCDSRAGQLALYTVDTGLQSARPVMSDTLTNGSAADAAVVEVSSVSAATPLSPAMAAAVPRQRTHDPVRLFVSYAHEDRGYKETLRKFLKPLERSHTIAVWDDRHLLAGSEWDAEIKQQMTDAQVFIVLVTAASVASDYIVSKELEAAIAGHRDGRTRVVPVLMEACAWKETVLRDFQMLPRDAIPVRSWGREDEAYQAVVEGIQAVVADIRGRSSRGG
jgi:WD40 repeat protein